MCVRAARALYFFFFFDDVLTYLSHLLYLFNYPPPPFSLCINLGFKRVRVCGVQKIKNCKIENEFVYLCQRGRTVECGTRKSSSKQQIGLHKFLISEKLRAPGCLARGSALVDCGRPREEPRRLRQPRQPHLPSSSSMHFLAKRCISWPSSLTENLNPPLQGSQRAGCSFSSSHILLSQM